MIECHETQCPGSTKKLCEFNFCIIFIEGASRIRGQETIISSNTIQLDVSDIASKAVYPEVQNNFTNVRNYYD